MTEPSILFDGPSLIHIVPVLSKYVTIGNLNAIRLGVHQHGKLFPACSGRKLAIILVQEPKQEVDRALGHVEHVLNRRAKLVVSSEKVRLIREVYVDGLLDTAVKKLSMRCGIKEAIEITGLICDLHIEAVCRLPFNQWQKSCRIALKNAAIVINAF